MRTIIKNECEIDKNNNAEFRDRKLFTAIIVGTNGPEQIQIFYAAIESDLKSISRRITEKFGQELADLAYIHVGFDPSEPLAVSSLSGATELILLQAADAPNHQASDGLEVIFESRFSGQNINVKERMSHCSEWDVLQSERPSPLTSP